MKSRCKKNPCCRDPFNCIGQSFEARSIPPMTAERAIYFLKRFKGDEKMLGPNEQLALDFAIAALSQQEESAR